MHLPPEHFLAAGFLADCFFAAAASLAGLAMVFFGAVDFAGIFLLDLIRRASSTAGEPVVPRLLAAHDLRRISASVMGACARVLSGWVRSLFFWKPGFASTQKSQSRYTLF